MTKSQKSANSAIEVADLTKELRKTKNATVLIRDHVFDTMNVPFKIVSKVHGHLIDAEKSLTAAAVALAGSK